MGRAKRLAVKGLLDDDDVAAVKAETEAIVDGLSDEEIPVEPRRALLRDFGITRLYVDNPSVRVELL
ncbi:MAG: hypothetical protein WAR57_05410 [Candidatus Phosphoribacter sp.]|nr:hypothetical protein [Actinomycetales bacterium]